MLPLCHPLLVGSVFVNFRLEEDHVEVETQVDTVDRTGVEMEALHACAVAALTIYDMCKSVDRGMTIGRARPVGEDRRPLRGLAPRGPRRQRHLRPLTRARPARWRRSPTRRRTRVRHAARLGRKDPSRVTPPQRDEALDIHRLHVSCLLASATRKATRSLGHLHHDPDPRGAVGGLLPVAVPAAAALRPQPGLHRRLLEAGVQARPRRASRTAAASSPCSPTPVPVAFKAAGVPRPTPGPADVARRAEAPP